LVEHGVAGSRFALLLRTSWIRLRFGLALMPKRQRGFYGCLKRLPASSTWLRRQLAEFARCPFERYHLARHGKKIFDRIGSFRRPRVIPAAIKKAG